MHRSAPEFRPFRIHADVGVRLFQAIEPVDILPRELSHLDRFVHHEVVIIVKERISANFAALVRDVDVRLKDIAQHARDPVVLNAFRTLKQTIDLPCFSQQ